MLCNWTSDVLLCSRCCHHPLSVMSIIPQLLCWYGPKKCFTLIPIWFAGRMARALCKIVLNRHQLVSLITCSLTPLLSRKLYVALYDQLLLHEMHKPLTCHSPNMSKVYAWQVGPNLLLKLKVVTPLSTIRNNKLNTQGEKLETAKLRVFSMEYILAVLLVIVKNSSR